MRKKLTLGLLALTLLCACTEKKEPDRKVFAENEFKEWAQTPPMGWNSWDCYGPTVEEHEVKANADYMAEHLLKYGWEYVVVDIRWFVEMIRLEDIIRLTHVMFWMSMDVINLP